MKAPEGKPHTRVEHTERTRAALTGNQTNLSTMLHDVEC